MLCLVSPSEISSYLHTRSLIWMVAIFPFRRWEHWDTEKLTGPSCGARRESKTSDSRFHILFSLPFLRVYFTILEVEKHFFFPPLVPRTWDAHLCPTRSSSEEDANQVCRGWPSSFSPGRARGRAQLWVPAGRPTRQEGLAPRVALSWQPAP